MGERAFETRLLKTGLSLCVLALIREKPRYGYDLVKTLRERGLALTNERSVYPLLGRMKEYGLLEAKELMESRDGPARKYYSLTTRPPIGVLLSSRETRSARTTSVKSRKMRLLRIRRAYIAATCSRRAGLQTSSAISR